MTGWFTCFIQVIVFLLYISEHFATIISPKLSVLFLNIFFNPFFIANICLQVTHTDIFILIGILTGMISWTSSSSSMLHFFSFFSHYLWHLVAYKYFTLAHFSLQLSFPYSLVHYGLLMFMYFSLIISFFQYPSLQSILPSQQQCLLGNIQPNFFRCIHDRLIHKNLTRP